MQFLRITVIVFAFFGSAFSADIKQDLRPSPSHSFPFIADVENSIRNYSRVDTVVHFIDDMKVMYPAGITMDPGLLANNRIPAQLIHLMLMITVPILFKI